MAVSESYVPAVIIICVEMNTTVLARSFKIGSLQFMLLPYEDAVSQTFVASCDVENVHLVQSGAPLPSFLCLVTGKSDWPLVLHSTHQKLISV